MVAVHQTVHQDLGISASSSISQPKFNHFSAIPEEFGQEIVENLHSRPKIYILGQQLPNNSRNSPFFGQHLRLSAKPQHFRPSSSRKSPFSASSSIPQPKNPILCRTNSIFGQETAENLHSRPNNSGRHQASAFSATSQPKFLGFSTISATLITFSAVIS